LVQKNKKKLLINWLGDMYRSEQGHPIDLNGPSKKTKSEEFSDAVCSDWSKLSNRLM
jgi:hypothetical protein